MNTKFHVRRERIQDRRAAHAQIGAPSLVGETHVSRTFPSRKQAEREAQAWQETGDWAVIILDGPAPRTKGHTTRIK